MKFNNRKFLKDEEGNALVIFIFMFVVFIGIAGVVIDMGTLYKVKSELRKTANTAVLSGGQQLLDKDSTTAVQQVVQNILNTNNEADCLKSISVTPNDRVKIRLEKNVSLNFMKFFGMTSVNVSADAAAGLTRMTSGTRAVPLGIDSSIPLTFDTSYTLKVGAGDSTTGNFGALALSGGGADLYGNDLMYGSNTDIHEGTVLNTQTGNIAGKTQNAINYRFNSSPYALGDTSNDDDPRIIKILVYTPVSYNGNQLASVKVTDFAYFYITSPLLGNSTEITGQFIRKVGIGSGSGAGTTESTTGAYAVKLLPD